jgi:hypothetical protein
MFLHDSAGPPTRRSTEGRVFGAPFFFGLAGLRPKYGSHAGDRLTLGYTAFRDAVLAILAAIAKQER